MVKLMEMQRHILFLVIFQMDHLTYVLPVPIIQQEVVDYQHSFSQKIRQNVIDYSLKPGNNLTILHDRNVLKEIEPGILQLIEKTSLINLTCQTITGNFVKWKYHGIMEASLMLAYTGNSIGIKSFISGPGVGRFECADHNISNSIVIYGGDNNPPFLYNHGKSVSVTILNETSVRFPCLLKYPLEHLDSFILQLLKDGEQIDENIIKLNYEPEFGYTLNWAKLENGREVYGSYECRVFNSTKNDVVRIEFTKGDVSQAMVHVTHLSNLRKFSEGDPNSSTFFCNVPKSHFENKFKWFLRWANGSETEIHPEKSGIQNSVPNPHQYEDSAKIYFPSRNITHVVCAGYLKENGTSFNSKYSVEIKEPKKLVVHKSPSDEIVYYSKGQNLTCNAAGYPISIRWLKNGENMKLLTSNDRTKGDEQLVSTITLNPTVDDLKSVYTCQAYNFLENVTQNFTVKLRDSGPSVLLTVGIALALFAIIALLAYLLFKIKVSPRKNLQRIIRQFFKGIPPDEACLLEGVEPESYECSPYNKANELTRGNLTFGENLQGGEFGVVFRGLYFDKRENKSIEVAIKTPKINQEDSVEQQQYELENFLNEIKYWQRLGKHPNVVRYIGSVTSDLGNYSAYLVLEYCCQGNLKSYLRNVFQNGTIYDDINKRWVTEQRPGYCNVIDILKVSHMMKWAEHIASGMHYISSEGFLHRDLAARNILLTGDASENCNDPGMLTAKISDFGMGKDLKNLGKSYYRVFSRQRYSNVRRFVPQLWMSPEAFKDRKFTTQNDVWAFGITLWEMFSLGRDPFECEDGQILPKPELVPEEIWGLIQECWNREPETRPNFADIKRRLIEINHELQRQTSGNIDDSRENEGNNVDQHLDTDRVDAEQSIEGQGRCDNDDCEEINYHSDNVSAQEATNNDIDVYDNEDEINERENNQMSQVMSTNEILQAPNHTHQGKNYVDHWDL